MKKFIFGNGIKKSHKENCYYLPECKKISEGFSEINYQKTKS